MKASHITTKASFSAIPTLATPVGYIAYSSALNLSFTTASFGLFAPPSSHS
jgi:hypothetical protein